MSLSLNQSLSRPVSATDSKTTFRRHITRRQQFSSRCLAEDGGGLMREKMPRHIGVIADGNRRWAVQRGWPNVAGYDVSFRRLHEIIRLCLRWGVDVLSVFCLSTGNLKRPQVEIDYFCNSFVGFLEDIVKHRSQEKVRISVIGNMGRLPKRLQAVARTAEEMTETNSELHLVLAIGYGGRDDVVAACKSIATKAKAGVVDPDSITEQVVEQELKTSCCEFPSLDLLIRPGREQRLSDYMLFQSAYAELYFDHHSMPDFGEEQFLEALKWFQERKRRFGV